MKLFVKVSIGFLVCILLIFAGSLFSISRYFKSFPKVSVTAEKANIQEGEIFSWIERIVGFGPRKPATEGDAKTRAFIEAKFIEFGLKPAEPEPVSVETARIDQWGLWLKDPKTGEDISVPAYPMPFSAPTTDDPIEAEIEYVGDGTAIEYAEVADKIVVFEQQIETHNWNLYKRLFFFYDPARSVPDGYATANLLDRTARAIHNSVAPRGAAGIIGLLSSLPWDSATYCPQLNEGVSLKIPGLWVSRSHSQFVQPFRDILEMGKHKKSLPPMKVYQPAKMLVSGERNHSETYNLWAMLPGQVDEYYIVMAHHDAPFDNAVQDASGVAVMLALAKHFSEVKEEKPLRRGIVFLAGGGHTIGRLGEMAFVQRHREDLLPKVALVVSVEHIAKEFLPREDLQFAVSEQPAVRMFFTAGSRKLSGIVQSSIIRNDFRRSVMIPQWVVKRSTGKARGISGEFYEAGLPVVGLLSNPPYMFFQEDTPSTVARDQLVPTTNIIISILRAADELPIPDLGD